MLSRLNSPYLALLFLAGFLALGRYSLHQVTLQQKQADAIRYIYGIADNESAAAIWGK